MGYTHYWYQKQNCPYKLWRRIFIEANRVLNQSDIPIVNQAEDNADEICFNGAEPDDYETFYLTKLQGQLQSFSTPEQGTFSCCKTSHLPYDTLVCMILAIAEQVAPEVYQVSSDGDLEDWLPALQALQTLQSQWAGTPQPLYYPHFLREQLLPTLLDRDPEVLLEGGLE